MRRVIRYQPTVYGEITHMSASVLRQILQDSEDTIYVKTAPELLGIISSGSQSRRPSHSRSTVPSILLVNEQY